MSDNVRNDIYADERVAEGYTDSETGELIQGHHVSSGGTGEVAGTGAGAISGGVVGAAVAGPIGAVVGAVAGGVLGAAGGEAAHHVGDDHDDVNVSTGSEGSLGRASGLGAGSISGAVVGAAIGGPVGAVAGAVAGGMLGASAGDAAKHFGEEDPAVVDDGVYETNDGYPAYNDTNIGTAATGLDFPDNNYGTSTRDQLPVSPYTPVEPLPGANLPPVSGDEGYRNSGPDTRGPAERAADAVTGDVYDDKTSRRID